MRTLTLAVFVLVLTWVDGHPQTLPASPGATVLARLSGAWSGTGTILGQTSTVEMQWTPVLDGRFVRLTFLSHIGPAPKTQRFEGHAYYEVMPDGGLRATWFDSSGLTRPIAAVTTVASLVATWGTTETELGETTYRLVSDAQIEVVDRVRRKDGRWREFGRSTLSRTVPPG